MYIISVFTILGDGPHIYCLLNKSAGWLVVCEADLYILMLDVS